MTIENLVKNCMMPVDWYASMLYNWEQHHIDEKQEDKDINKPGGFIRIFVDAKGNNIYILRSKNIDSLPETIENEFSEKSIQQMKELLTKDFYFCMIKNFGSGEVTFPNEVWLTLDEAKKNCAKYLK